MAIPTLDEEIDLKPETGEEDEALLFRMTPPPKSGRLSRLRARNKQKHSLTHLLDKPGGKGGGKHGATTTTPKPGDPKSAEAKAKASLHKGA